MSLEPASTLPPGLAPRPERRLTERLTLFLARGFGLGAILPAPGTWGSLLGLPLSGLLAWSGSYPVYLVATFACLAISVPICTKAERLLGRKDPGSVVLDEWTAMPLCYLGWVTDVWLTNGRCSLDVLFSAANSWWVVGLGFLLFRLLDIIKPWPIRSIQKLPGGWGVVLDDALAALGTALIVLLLHRAL